MIKGCSALMAFLTAEGWLYPGQHNTLGKCPFGWMGPATAMIVLCLKILSASVFWKPGFWARVCTAACLEASLQVDVDVVL